MLQKADIISHGRGEVTPPAVDTSMLISVPSSLPLYLTQVSREVRNACYSSVSLDAAPAPKLVILSEAAAALTGIPLETARAAKRRRVEDGGVQLKQVALALTGTNLGVFHGAQPFSSNYGGHQFGNWAGQLGDGRVCTLGEIQTVGHQSQSQIEEDAEIWHGSLVEVRLSPEILHQAVCMTATGSSRVCNAPFVVLLLITPFPRSTIEGRSV